MSTAAVDLPALFLGVPNGTQDERTLLGLPGDVDLTREAVLAALRDRLRLISVHPLASTPEAAEVRMLLHASVARLLLGPNARALQESGEQSLTPLRNDQPQGRDVSRFEELAMLTLAQHGGWTKHAMHHLQLVAASSGIPPEQIARAMADLSMQTWAGGAAAARSADLITGPTVTGPRAALISSAATNAQRTPEKQLPARRMSALTPEERDARIQSALVDFGQPSEEDPARRMVRNGLIGAGVGLLSLVVVAVGLRFMFSGKNMRTAAPGGSAPGASASPAPGSASSGAVSGPLAASNPSASTPVETNVSTPATRMPDAIAASPTQAVPARPVTELLAALRTFASAQDPANAAPELVNTLQELATAWTSASPGELIACADAVAEFAYRGAGNSETLSPLVAHVQRELALLLPPSVDPGALVGSAPEQARWSKDRIERGALGAGLAARLLRERDLPTSLRVPLRRRLAESLGGSLPSDQGTMHQAMTAALDRLATLMVQPGASAGVARITAPDAYPAWGAWAQASQSLLQDTPDEHTNLLLLALERIMTKGPEPSQDPMISGALTTLVRALPIGAGSPARPAILRWMVAGDISSVDLFVLTGALVQLPESGLEMTATLSAAATEYDRQQLRDRYANLWQVTQGSLQDDLAQRWRTNAANLLSQTPGRGLDERLSYALSISTLNTAGHAVLAGDALATTTLLEAASRPVTRWTSTSALTTLDQGTPTWGEAYLRAGSDIPKRREILQTVTGEPGALEARVLVEEATRSGSAEVRRDARAVLSRVLDRPVVIKSLLDFGPFIPATRENSRLIEQAAGTALPAPRASSWRVDARRALLRRLLERVAPDDSSLADVAADHLLTDYRQRADGFSPSVPAGDESQDLPTDQPAPDVSQERPARAENLPMLPDVPRLLLAGVRDTQALMLAQVQRGWLADPAFTSAADVLSTRDARLAATDTDLQRFVVEINALIELQARATVINDRASKDQVLAVLAAWRQDASAALHVYEQIAAGEVAQARLWMIRFGGQVGNDGPGSAPGSTAPQLPAALIDPANVAPQPVTGTGKAGT